MQHGNYQGVTWIKSENVNPIHGFTTITVDGCEMHFHGHTSNAKAWTYIAKISKKRGVRIINGKIYTK